MLGNREPFTGQADATNAVGIVRVGDYGAVVAVISRIDEAQGSSQGAGAAAIGKPPRRAAMSARHGIGAVALLLVVLCVVAVVPLLVQAAWTSRMIGERQAADSRSATAAIAQRVAARLEQFGVHAGGVLHAADARLRLAEAAAAANSDFLNPLLASAGIHHVALLRPDGRLGRCLAPPGRTCPVDLAWLQDRPDLVQRAFQPGGAMFAAVARDETGASGILLVRPPQRADTSPDATLAWLAGAQFADIVEAGSQPQPDFVAIHDRDGRLLYHEDPALRALRHVAPAAGSQAAGSQAAAGQPGERPAAGGFVDPADGRTYPASIAPVAGLDLTVTAYRRDQGLTGLADSVWTLALGLLALVLAGIAILVWLARRSLAAAVRQLIAALSTLRQSASSLEADQPVDAPPGTAEQMMAQLARHPVREIRQVAGSVATMATAVRQRQDRDAETARAAKLSNDKRSAFVANISHQLRTPLNSIIGFSEMMTDQLFGPLGHAKYLEYAQSVHNSGEYLMRILNDLRDLSRAEIGSLDLEETTLDVGRLLRSSVSIVSREARVHNVHLALIPSDEMPVIRGDEQRLQQALINLLNHSVQSSPADGRVEIAAVMAQSGELQVRIHDDGPPIADRDLAKLLTPFDEVQRSYDRRFEGSGLGLPLARTMLDLHGGRLDIQSMADNGNTLTAILPGSRVLRQTAA